jgi:hypothetical protein
VEKAEESLVPMEMDDPFLLGLDSSETQPILIEMTFTYPPVSSIEVKVGRQLGDGDGFAATITYDDYETCEWDFILRPCFRCADHAFLGNVDVKDVKKHRRRN